MSGPYGANDAYHIVSSDFRLGNASLGPIYSLWATANGLQLRGNNAATTYTVQGNIAANVANISTSLSTSTVYGNLSAATANVSSSVSTSTLYGNVSGATVSGNLSATTANVSSSISTPVVYGNLTGATANVSSSLSTPTLYGNVSGATVSGNLSAATANVSSSISTPVVYGNLTGATANVSYSLSTPVVYGNLSATTANVTSSLQLGPPGPYYGNATAYNPSRFANITAGSAAFNGDGGVYTSGGGIRLAGQDLSATPASGAVIEIEGGRAPLGSAQGSEIRFYTSGSQRAVLDKDGYFQLGTSSKLAESSGLLVSTNGYERLRVMGDVDGTKGNCVMRFGSTEASIQGASPNNTLFLYMKDVSGNPRIGIGTYSPTETVSIVGNVKIQESSWPCTVSVGGIMNFGNPPVSNNIICLWGDATNPNSFSHYGFGVNSYTLRYQTSASDNSHKFYGGSTLFATINSSGVTTSSVAATAGINIAQYLSLGYNVETSGWQNARMALIGGSSYGYFFSAYNLFDGINLAYNYYHDNSSGSIPNAGGATSRIALGFGYVNMYAGATNTAPTALALQAAQSAGTGLVGINQTADPNYNLTVNGSIYASSSIRVPSTGTYWTASDNNTFLQADVLALKSASASGITFRKTSGYSAFLYSDGSNFALLRGAVDTVWNGWSTVNGYWPMTISLSTNHCTMGGDVYIPAGNLGIGTTGPNYKLHVYGGEALIYGAANSNMYLRLEAPTAAYQTAIQFSKAGAQKWVQYVPGNSDNMVFYTGPGNKDAMSLDSGGNLVIAGTGFKPGGGSWDATSDARIKQNVQTANLALCYDIIQSLPLRYFEYTDDYLRKNPSLNDRHQVGWIADEVEKYFPKSVTSHACELFGYPADFGLKTLDADQLLKVAVGALQHLMQRLALLEQKYQTT